MNTKVTILFLLVAIAGTINIAPAEANQFRKLFTSPGQVLPPGTFQTCDAMIQYAQTHSPMKNPQCSEIILRPCCDECTYDQQNPSCQTCGKMQFYSNIHKLQATGCLTPPPTRSNRRLRSRKIGELLSEAVRNGNLRQVKKLLIRGANVNYEDISGNTPLNLAAERKNARMVKLILDMGKGKVDVNKKNERGQTPLLNAIWGFETADKVRIVKMLLENLNTDRNTESLDATTPLRLAIANNPNVLRMLLKDPRVKMNKVNRDGKTPLGVAYCWDINNSLGNRFKTLAMLKRSGATVCKGCELCPSSRSLKAEFNYDLMEEDSSDNEVGFIGGLFKIVKTKRQTQSFDEEPSRRKCNKRARIAFTARLSMPMKYRLYMLKKMQPKCSQMSFERYCNECSHFMDDSEFDQCMIKTNIPETPKEKEICTNEIIASTAFCLKQKFKTRFNRWCFDNERS